MIQALREIGKDKARPAELKQIIKLLKKEDVAKTETLLFQSVFDYQRTDKICKISYVSFDAGFSQGFHIFRPPFDRDSKDKRKQAKSLNP